jgi:hypothetical protein
MTSRTLLRTSTLLSVLLFLGSGCSSTGWSQAEIESKIKEGGKLKEIHLTQTGSGDEREQNGAVTQTRSTRSYEGTGAGENGHTYKIKATYTYEHKDGKGSHDFHWEADDSQGGRMSQTYKGSSGVIVNPR